MTFLDLLARGINITSSIETNDVSGDVRIILRFDRGGRYYNRAIGRKEIVLFDGGGTGSVLVEALICREVLAFWGIEVDETKLKIGDWAICSESGVIGQIIKTYTPTACEDQIMVETRDGRQYHAPARTWKPYLFGTSASQVCTDEVLNEHGKYAVRFAKNHGISINGAMDRPTVKAHQAYYEKLSYNQKVLKPIDPNQKNTLKNGG